MQLYGRRCEQMRQERDTAVHRAESMQQQWKYWTENESLRIKEEVNGYDDNMQQLLLQVVTLNHNKKRRYNYIN